MHYYNMYHLTFIEGVYERRNFYYHNLKNALNLQRELLIVEINNLISEETGYDQLKIYGWFDVKNEELQKLLNILIELTYKDDCDNFQIKIEVEEIKFQDDVKIEDYDLLTRVL